MKNLKSRLLSSLSVFLTFFLVTFSITSFAQNSNINTNTDSRKINQGSISANSSGLINSNTNRAPLTNSTIEKNTTGSCDSTCDAMSGTPSNPNSISSITNNSSYTTRVVACGPGYTGQKTQTRNQTPSGTFTAWVDRDISQCVCSPTFTDSTQACSAPLSGTYIQRTPWVCINNVGSLGSPSTISNSCFTPCAPSSSQSRVGSCPIGYDGQTLEQRDSYCPGGLGSNSVAQYGPWNEVSNACALPPTLGDECHNAHRTTPCNGGSF